MDHYKHPRHKGTIEHPHAEHTEKNPSCGDTCHITLTVKDGVIQDAKFDGEGCAISIAGASMLLEELEGASVKDALSFSREDMLELIGVPLTTMRVKCGLLGLHTLKKTLCKLEGAELQGEW